MQNYLDRHGYKSSTVKELMDKCDRVCEKGDKLQNEELLFLNCRISVMLPK